MSYLDIPLATQTLAASQPQIRTNFSLIKADIGRDHVPMDAATINDRGKHKFVEYLVQAADPAPVGPLATDSYLFSKTVAGVTQMFWKRVGGSAVRMTGPDPVIAADGFTFLPGGLLLQWGSLVVPATESGAITFPQAFSAVPYSINVTAARTNTASATPMFVSTSHPVTATDFRIVNTSSNAHTGYWMAIGPQ